MSEKDKREYAAIKADPVKYAAYLERKRLARLRRQADKGYGTKRKRRWRAANRAKDRAMHAANYAVEKALKQGKITRPDACQGCNKSIPLEGHHHLGYAPEHRMDIVWLCQMCHSREHRRVRP